MYYGIDEEINSDRDLLEHMADSNKFRLDEKKKEQERLNKLRNKLNNIRIGDQDEIRVKQEPEINLDQHLLGENNQDECKKEEQNDKEVVEVCRMFVIK
jgi:hypothetical protein